MRHPPSRGARMTVHMSYIRCQSYNVEIDSFPCKRPAGRPYFFRKGVLAYALVRKRYSLLIHHFFMSSFYIYEGMKVATLVATLRLRIMYMILKIVLKILCSMWVKYTMKFDFKNCILVQNSSKMFWRFYAVCGSNTLWILILIILYFIF